MRLMIMIYNIYRHIIASFWLYCNQDDN